MRRFGQWRQIGDPAEDVGILHDHRARLAVDPCDQTLSVRCSAQVRQRSLELILGELRHRPGDAHVMGMHARGDDRHHRIDVRGDVENHRRHHERDREQDDGGRAAPRR